MSPPGEQKRLPWKVAFSLLENEKSLVTLSDVMSDEMSDGAMDKAAIRWSKIEGYLKTHPFIMNADVRDLCGVSAATANRILAGLVEEGKLLKCREGGHWAYKLYA